MELSLQQAAERLGKTQRQIDYMIKTGRLTAKKNGGRWRIDSGDLPLSEGQQQSFERKQHQFRAVVEETLDIEPNTTPAKRYSVRDLKAFQITLPLHRRAASELGAEHAATQSLKRVLEQLTYGCHRFERSDKAEAYRAARDEASLAVCELVLTESATADELIHAIEQDLMAAMAGLLRHVDRRRRM